MSNLRLGSLWTILRQVNVGEIHAEAERKVDIIVAGPSDGLANELADLLRNDEVTTADRPASIVRTVDALSDPRALAGADLLIGLNIEPQMLTSVRGTVPVILVNTGTAQPPGHPATEHVSLPAIDRKHVEHALAPLVVKQLGDKALAAARRLPILRHAYAEWLLNETSRANALYALSTGIAETVPVLNIPLNMADIVVLTKNQLIMVYQLALAAGRPKSPVAVIGELMGVIGAGFLWRQIARELVGLIPVVGIVPKVAVAYAGTYAIGQAAQTYLVEGKVPGEDQLKTLYTRAIERGQELAKNLARGDNRN